MLNNHYASFHSYVTLEGKNWGKLGVSTAPMDPAVPNVDYSSWMINFWEYDG